MADLNDLISQASSNQSGTTSKASLLDYADKPQTVEPGQEEPGQNPMLSQEDVSQMSRQGAVSAVEQQIDPGVGGLSERDRQAITDTGVDPELIFEGNAEKFGKSLVAGVGVVVNDIGNMMDYAAMTILPDEIRKSDTFMNVVERLPNFHQYGDALQKWGEVHQSPGLDEFTLDDMFKVEFWATDVAKTLPYMAAMIVPGAQGAGVARGLMAAGARSAAKRGLFGSAKQLVKRRAASVAKGSSKAKIVGETAMPGSGVMGAMATAASGTGEIALSGLGTNVANFLGSAAGTTGVIGAGLAGDVYNRGLDMGMTEEEAQTAAHGTFVDNSKWFALNGLSWGMQFGGLSGRAFKQFNKMKGGAESAKVIQKTFAQRLRTHAAKGIATGTVEGTEEMFQETYEEWIQQKNLAEAVGKEFIGYTDFLTSDENRKTLGVSFAAGFLMGGRGGFMDSVAENGRRITNKRVSIDDDINSYENMSDAQKKVKTNETIEAAIREDQVDGLNVMLDKLEAAGKISSEDRAEYDATILAYSEIAATLPFKEKLTEAGQQTLFNIKVKELQSKKSLENLEVIKAKSIAEANENLEGESLTNELAKIEAEHKTNVSAVENSIAEGKQAVSKLLSSKKQSGAAKKADTKRSSEIDSFKESEEYNNLTDTQKSELEAESKALKEKIKENSYEIDEANESADGLTEAEYDQFTKQGETEKAQREKQEAEDKVQKVSDTLEKGADVAKETGKGIISKAKSFAGKAVDFVKQKFADKKKQDAFRKAVRPVDKKIQELIKEGKTSEEILEAIKGEISVDGVYKAEGVTDADVLSYIKTVSGEVQESTEAEAEESVDKKEAPITDENIGAVNAEVDALIDSMSEEDLISEIEKLVGTKYEAATSEEIAWALRKLVKQRKDGESKESTDNKETGKDDSSSTEEEGTKKAQSSDKKTKPKAKADEDVTFAESMVGGLKKMMSGLIKKSNKISKSKASERVKELFKDGFGTVPNSEKLMKTKDGVSESKPTPLQYFSSINPALESAIIAAASKKFPTKQLLILREVISSQGELVAGMALGSAVQVKAGSGMGVAIMHEYGHVYYALMKDNPSFIRGVGKITKSKIFRDIKNLYSEDIMYSFTMNGVVSEVSGMQLFTHALQNKGDYPQEIQEAVEAFAESQLKNDEEAGKVLFDKVIAEVVKSSPEILKVLPDSKQEKLIEEAFVTSLGPQMAGQLNMLFDKGPDVVQYEGFLKKLKGRISNLITPKDAKDILENVDKKFENMSIEEIGNAIIDDISSGVNKGKYKSGKAKYMKFGKLSKEIGAVVSVEINKALEGEKMSFDKAVNLITEKATESLQDPESIEEVRIEVERRLATEYNTRNQNTLDPDKANSDGVKRIYDKAGYNSGMIDQQGENIDEDAYSSEIDEYMDGTGEDNTNVISSDYQKQLAMDNSSSHFLKAIMMIANPVGKNAQYNKSRLEAEIFKLAKANRNRGAYFINAMKNSSDPHIVELMRILNENTEKEEQLAILNEFHNHFRNKFLETILITSIKGDGNIIEQEAIAGSERRQGERILKSANNVFFKSKGADIRKEILGKILVARENIAKGKGVTMNQALRIMAPIIYMSDNGQYLDMDALVTIRTSVKGKQLSLPQLVESWVTGKDFENHLKSGKISIQTPEFKNLVKGMVVSSRSKNAIKTVTNVEGKATSVMNMNSHLLNQQQHIVDQAKTEEGRDQLEKKYPGNPLIKMVVALGAQGLESEAFKLGIDGGTISYTGTNNKTATFQNKTKEDIFFGDLESFVNSHDGGKPGKSRTYYTQPISIFSNSKRRYSVQMPMVTTPAGKKAAVAEVKANGLDKKEYLESTPKNPLMVLDLTNKSIATQVDAIIEMIKANPGVLKDNPVLGKIASIDAANNVVVTPAGLKILNDYAFNFALNTIYAQELFIGSHTQSKSQSDYIKRATGAIARHDGSMRGVSIEPIIFEDSDIKEETDAGSFILPEDVPFVQDRVGPKMGHLFKFVHYGTDKRGEGANDVHEDNDTYLKTAVHVLTPEMIGDSKVLQNIADKLRARRKKNGYGESLNIALFESAAKKFPSIHGGNKSIAHDADFGTDSQAQKELDTAYMVGNKLVGIDGSNMGIQLPMDKERNKSSYPTQHVGSNNNDLTTEEALEMDKIQALEAEIFNDSLDAAVGAMIADQKESTPESREAVKVILSRVVGRNAISSVTNGAAKLLASANPKISQNLPALHKYYADGIRSLIKKSAKIITNGTIAIQATSVGKGLKAYEGGVRYNAAGESRAVTLPAESVVPASLKGKYMARVDQKFGSLRG